MQVVCDGLHFVGAVPNGIIGGVKVRKGETAADESEGMEAVRRQGRAP